MVRDYNNGTLLRKPIVSVTIAGVFKTEMLRPMPAEPFKAPDSSRHFHFINVFVFDLYSQARQCLGTICLAATKSPLSSLPSNKIRLM